MSKAGESGLHGFSLQEGARGHAHDARCDELMEKVKNRTVG